MDSREESIFKTLLYSDLFDYPLTESEIHKFLIAQKIEKNELSKILKNGKLPIQEDDNFFFIKGRGKIVNARLSKEKFSLEKLEKAKKITRFLGLIPTIKLIGVSGTLAMKNCSVDDDIDLFIAGISLDNDMVIATNNENHFKKIKELKIENWSK